MVEDEDKKEAHESFKNYKLKLNSSIGYYSLLAVLFNPYSIAISSAKVFKMSCYFQCITIINTHTFD